MQFSEMPLIRPLREAVREAGYETATPIQEATIPIVLEGRDLIGCAQTGTGKTAAFALPILQRLAQTPKRGHAIRALIVTATRELTIQNYEAFRDFGKRLPLRSAVIFGGVNQASQVEALSRGVDILAATPGRLNDLIGQGYIDLSTVECFVLDEADRMLDMGFIHDVRKIITRLPEKRQTLLFSATMPPDVEALAKTMLRDPATVKVDSVDAPADTVSQTVCYVEKADKNKLLLHLLDTLDISSALVFTRTKHGADQVARVLQRNGVAALAIHGNKSQNARQNALSQFKAGEIRVLVATDIAARGIDISELPYVINYNISEEAESYIHRIGRTGRAGLTGKAISLCCAEELTDFRDIEKRIGRTVPVLDTPYSVTGMTPVKRVRNQGRNQPAAQPAAKHPAPKQPEKKPAPAAKQAETASGQSPAPSYRRRRRRGKGAGQRPQNR